MKKPPYLCSRNQTTNKFNHKITAICLRQEKYNTVQMKFFRR